MWPLNSREGEGSKALVAEQLKKNFFCGFPYLVSQVFWTVRCFSLLALHSDFVFPPIDEIDVHNLGDITSFLVKHMCVF